MDKKEMIKQVKKVMDTVGNKYHIIENENSTIIKVNGYKMIDIIENMQYRFYIEDDMYNFYLDDKQKEDLYEILTEYAFTPIEKRQEKRYVYFYEDPCTKITVFLKYDKKHGTYALSSETLNDDDYQSDFTDSELEELGMDMKLLNENYTKVLLN